MVLYILLWLTELLAVESTPGFFELPNFIGSKTPDAVAIKIKDRDDDQNKNRRTDQSSNC